MHDFLLANAKTYSQLSNDLFCTWLGLFEYLLGLMVKKYKGKTFSQTGVIGFETNRAYETLS